MQGHMCAKKIWIKQNRPFEPSCWVATPGLVRFTCLPACLEAVAGAAARAYVTFNKAHCVEAMR